MTKLTIYVLKNPGGAIFQQKKSACGKHIDHGVVGGGRGAHAIVTSYNYTDTLQVYRHPEYKSRHPEYMSRHPNTPPLPHTQVQTLKNQVQTSKIQVRAPKMEVQTPKYKSGHLRYTFGSPYGHI